MANPNWPFDDTGDDEFFQKSAEAMLTVLAMDRGGQITLYESKINAAIEKMREKFPKGMHIHFDKDPGSLTMKLADASTCDRKRDSTDKGGEVDWNNGTITRFRPGSGGQVGGHVVENAEELTREDLLKLNHAQHVLLAVALSRLDSPTIECGVGEYDQATLSRGGIGGRGALLVSRQRDKFVASLLSDVDGGSA